VTPFPPSADGSSVSNTEPEEKERKQTLASHLFHFAAGKARVNALDTPGHPDVVADAIAYGAEGMDLAIIYLPAPYEPAVVEAMAETIRDSGLWRG
jgi:translation elongation factor EF-G